MLAVLGTIWPLAVGAAISPSITVIVFALLAAAHGSRLRVYAFWLGAALSLCLWAVIVSSFMWGLLQDATRDIERYSTIIDLTAGTLLIVVAILRFINHHRPIRDRKHIDFRGLSEGRYRRQVVFGAVMQGRNVTSVLLFCAAQQHIDVAPIAVWQEVLLTGSVIAIATASIWLVLIIPSTAITRFDRWTEPTHGWLTRHAPQIETLAALGFGAYLVVSSIIRLA